ncbi:Cytoplasmic membrane protein [Pseudomonas ficuserectae]|uniref:Cytoplasmic membrane protein n=33 Tax=Pseudomonas TaxID=286 RepID=A0A0Q0BT93_PSEAJ|nr:Cytoplasmic membrane family protein [Pseudomonas amygdali]KPW63523.1 Cytoplasmic membrane family protein [Pseudomonas syringae pv. broussonetiae]KPW64357.1 Cytoplasmic membrane family protein [Pseudomonas amygdali pv. ciccaronei]KPW86010.1 Cytoplasmic membrane family protein [Pseudomonas syringae pv. cerasicola]KPW88435.1 Cytoplasmic membrane family protein [Pseudomonas syringae pv. castaneae]KPX04489.1 Cytoplasmic membrane family protein [Pseudomonas syringae pv. cunninghamiae]KPX08884.1 
MMRVFLLLFLLFPVLELFLLVRVGMSIGFLWTFLLVVATSMLGLFVMRVAGFATALRARESLARGELPAQEMLEGLMVAVGGGLLLLPGFISDILGVICLLPITRRLLINKVRRRAEDQAMRQRAFADDLQTQANQGPASHRPNAIHQPTREPDVIEGEFEHRDK